MAIRSKFRQGDSFWKKMTRPGPCLQFISARGQGSTVSRFLINKSEHIIALRQLSHTRPLNVRLQRSTRDALRVPCGDWLI